MGWNCVSISKLQRLHLWSLGRDKSLHPTLYNGCTYLSVLGLKLIHVSKMGPWSGHKDDSAPPATCHHCEWVSLRVLQCSWTIEGPLPVESFRKDCQVLRVRDYGDSIHLWGHVSCAKNETKYVGWCDIIGRIFFHSNIAATWTKVHSLIRAVIYFQTGRTDKAVDTLRVAQGLGMISTAELVDSLDIFPGQIVGSYFDQDKWLTCLLKSIILPENVIVWIRFVHWTGLGVSFVYSTGYI